MRRFANAVVGLCLVCMTAGAGMGAEKEFTFTVKKGEVLDVRLHEGSITVHTWDRDEVSLRVLALDEDDLAGIRAVQGGGKVLVDDQNGGDVSIVARIPATFEVDLKTGGGDVGVKGSLQGQVRISTGGGTVAIGAVTGDVHLQTAGGDVMADEVTGDLRLQTAGGNVTVKGVTGTAEVGTAGGNIDVGTIGRALRASTAGGDVRLGSVGGECQISTSGGNIAVGTGSGKTSLTSAGGDIEMRSGRGAVSAVTSGGNITLHDIRGSVRARSAAGDLIVVLDPAVGESSTISTGAGNITLSIRADAKATIVARSTVFLGDEGAGSIRSDYPVLQRKRGEAEVQLGGGGHRVMLETKMGDIAITKK